MLKSIALLQELIMGHKFSILVPGAPMYTDLGFVGFCNVVLIEADSKYVIFDPGHYGNREYLLRELGSRGLRVSDIDYVIISHLHYDHAINSLLFKNAKIILSEKERDYAVNTASDPYVADFLLQILRNKVMLVRDNEEFLGIRFIELPGHTGGTMGVLLNDGTAIVGDAIKYVDDAVKRKTSFAYYDLNEANRSINKVLSLARFVIPGHDVPFRVINGKVEVTGQRNKLSIYLKGNIDISIIKLY
jgi:glyoxylase-like metal-dependent hydrolase (beta-lactamase superfamily II)